MVKCSALGRSRGRDKQCGGGRRGEGGGVWEVVNLDREKMRRG